MFFKHFYVWQPTCLGFFACLDFFEIHRCFVDCRAKFYSSAVFFMERWSFSLQDQIFLVFCIFSTT